MLVVIGILVAILVAAYVLVAWHGARQDRREKSDVLRRLRGRDVWLGTPEGERSVRILGVADEGTVLVREADGSQRVIPLSLVRSVRRSPKKPGNRW